MGCSKISIDHLSADCLTFDICHSLFECWFFDISFPTIVPFQCWYFENYHLRSTPGWIYLLLASCGAFIKTPSLLALKLRIPGKWKNVGPRHGCLLPHHAGFRNTAWSLAFGRSKKKNMAAAWNPHHFWLHTQLVSRASPYSLLISQCLTSLHRSRRADTPKIPLFSIEIAMAYGYSPFSDQPQDQIVDYLMIISYIPSGNLT